MFYNVYMNIEQAILMKIQSEINYLIVYNDLKHLPQIMFLLQKYAHLNDIKIEINSRDLELLDIYNEIYK